MVNEKETGSQTLHVDLVGGGGSALTSSLAYLRLEADGQWLHHHRAKMDGPAQLYPHLRRVAIPARHLRETSTWCWWAPEGAQVTDASSRTPSRLPARRQANRPIRSNVSDLAILYSATPTARRICISSPRVVVVTENDGDGKELPKCRCISKVEPAIDATDCSKTSHGAGRSVHRVLDWHPTITDGAERSLR